MNAPDPSRGRQIADTARVEGGITGAGLAAPKRLSIREQMSYRVRREAHRAGITQVELAKRTGLTTKHVSQILTGKENGSFEVWQDLAEAVGRRWHLELW